MKPYQVHLFSEDTKFPDFLPSEPVFVYEDKRYLNFLVFDCFHLKNNEYLKESAKMAIDTSGIASTEGRIRALEELQKAMHDVKKVDSLLLFPDEIAALFAAFSIFSPSTTFFIDYETSPSFSVVLQHRPCEYYSHRELGQLSTALKTKAEKVVVIDGIYEWLGSLSPVHDVLKIAKENEAFVIANEINSFGFLGRDGRGFIDLLNIYDDIHMEIGSFSKFLGGFGCYIGAKKYLMNKIKENTVGIIQPMPQFMLAVNCAGIEFIKSEHGDTSMYQKLWKNSRYFITRLKQIGFSTLSETPIIVVSFKNNEEAAEFRKRLFLEQIIVGRSKERIRLCLSIEHTVEDLNYCLDRCESIGKELGIIPA